MTFVVTEKLKVDFNNALKFTEKTHKKDIEWIKTRNVMTRDFDDFFYNYIYVVVASGFKALVAARITPQLFACKGDIDKMRKIFRNEQKLKAIEKVWGMRNQWNDILEKITDVDSLKQFPRIGDVVKHHLARNIGLISCGKADLHLTRFASSYGCDDPLKMIEALACELQMEAGVVDFIIWVWLSHNKGEKEAGCCNSEYSLR